MVYQRFFQASSSGARWVLMVFLAGLVAGGGHRVAAQAQSGTKQPRAQPAPSSPQKPQQEQAPQQAPSPGQQRVSSMSVSGASGAEALRVERRDPQQIRAGQPFEYQIVVTNTSDQPVRQVVVREHNPGGMQIDQAQPSRSPESSATENVWQLGTLNPGQSRTLTVTATPPAQGQMQACLTVDFKPTLCSQLQVVQPELKLERQFVDSRGRHQEQFLACEDIYAQYRLTNVGTGATREARIEEQFNDLVRTQEDKQALVLTTEPLPAGESAEQRVQLQVSGQTGSYTGAATATTGELTARSTPGTLAIVQPRLQLQVTGPQQEYIDRPVTYNVRVQNVGDGPALDTRVSLEMPDNIERVSFSGQNVERQDAAFLLGRLNAGESRDFSLSFNSADPAQVKAQAVARAYCAEEQQARIVTQVVGIPAIRLEVIDLKDPVRVGENTTYEIRVKNQGSAPDSNLQLQAELPPALQFVDARGVTAVQSQGQKLQFGTIEQLAPGELVTWYVQAKASEAVGDVQLKLQLKSESMQRPINEQEPTTLY